jgi:hypothetical protein
MPAPEEAFYRLRLVLGFLEEAHFDDGSILLLLKISPA